MTDAVTDAGPDPARVWRELRGVVVDGLDGHRRDLVAATGLPFSRIRALRRLRVRPLCLGELAEAMMVDRPAASVAVADLRARGLVRREPHPDDRRRKLVSLTAEGRRVVEVADRVEPAPPPGWSELGPEELVVLDRVATRTRAGVPPG